SPVTVQFVPGGERRLPVGLQRLAGPFGRGLVGGGRGAEIVDDPLAEPGHRTPPRVSGRWEDAVFIRAVLGFEACSQCGVVSAVPRLSGAVQVAPSGAVPSSVAVRVRAAPLRTGRSGGAAPAHGRGSAGQAPISLIASRSSWAKRNRRLP